MRQTDIIGRIVSIHVEGKDADARVILDIPAFQVKDLLDLLGEQVLIDLEISWDKKIRLAIEAAENEAVKVA